MTSSSSTRPATSGIDQLDWRRADAHKRRAAALEIAPQVRALVRDAQGMCVRSRATVLRWAQPGPVGGALAEQAGAARAARRG